MRTLLPLLLVLSTGCASTTPEPLPSLEQNLEAARAAWEAHPGSEDAAIWVGRRLGYLARYQEAVDWYTAALEQHPDSFRLLRHRGHRYITLREFELAVADLSAAAQLIDGIPDELEPDGAPNPAGIPRSTNHSNIYYHLGLAHYLRADYQAARSALERGLQFSQVNDDMLVATSNWLYATLRRQGLDADAGQILVPITPEMDLLENFAYWKLLRLNKGELTVADVAPTEEDAVLSATLAYGLGNYHHMRGEEVLALEQWSVLADQGAPAAFGTIAAQADLARIRVRANEPSSTNDRGGSAIPAEGPGIKKRP